MRSTVWANRRCEIRSSTGPVSTAHASSPRRCLAAAGSSSGSTPGSAQPVAGDREQDRPHTQRERRVGFAAATQRVLEERDPSVGRHFDARRARIGPDRRLDGLVDHPHGGRGHGGGDSNGEEVLDPRRPADGHQADHHDDCRRDAHDEVLDEHADHVAPTGLSAARISRSASAASVRASSCSSWRE